MHKNRVSYNHFTNFVVYSITIQFQLCHYYHTLSLSGTLGADIYQSLLLAKGTQHVAKPLSTSGQGQVEPTQIRPGRPTNFSMGACPQTPHPLPSCFCILHRGSNKRIVCPCMLGPGIGCMCSGYDSAERVVG